MYKRIALVFLCLIFSLPPLWSQTLDVNYNRRTIEQVIADLEQKTDYTFVYQTQELSGTPQITLNLRNASFPAVLESVCSIAGLEYEIIQKTVVLRKASPNKGPADRFLARGRVFDSDGFPAVGATVFDAKTNKGVATDVNGTYSLEVPRGTLLTISSVGFETVNILASASGDVTLSPDVQFLGQAVVTGYQTISKERATGAFDKVETDHLAQPTTNVGERLIGSAAGLAATTDANGDISFQIRGLSTLVASNKDPLLIVDGFPIEAPINSLNPNTIESITVLKDAAAASIWGAKAANGVIVVTTKNGQNAAGGKGNVQVTFNSMWKLSPKIDNDYWSANASNQQIIDWELYQFENAQFGYMALIGDSNANNNLRYNYNSYSNLFVMLNENRLGYVSDSELQSYIARIRTQSNKQQIKDYLLANPFTQQYNLNIAQNGERINSNVAFLYEGGQRYLQGNSYNKYTFNSNTTVKVYKWLDFNINGAFYYNVAHENGTGFLGPEFDLFFDQNGDYTDTVRQWLTQNERTYYTPNIRRHLNWTQFPYEDWGYNPVQEMRGRNYTTKTLDARIQTGLKFKFAPGINFESKFQYEMLKGENRKVDDPTTWYVRSTINMGATSDKTPTGKVTPNYPSGSMLRQSWNQVSAYDWRNQFNFDRTFAGRHQLTFIAGAEISDRVYQAIEMPLTYGYNDETLAVGKFLGSAFAYKNYTGANLTFGDTVIKNLAYTQDRYFSAYANVAYTLDGKYTLSASARTDASNFITDDPKYRYAPFWSVGAKWIASKEDFLASADGVDYLAFRLTYGYNGNVDRNTSVWPVLSYNTAQDALIQDHTATFSSFGNTSMRWERTGTVDFGIDFDFWGGALSGKLDIYNKKGRDLLATINLPGATGAASNKINAAEMTNRGFELELGTSQKWGDFSWHGNLMLAYNFNRIDKMIRTSYTGYNLTGNSGGDEARYRAGYNANTLWSYEYGGMINIGTDAAPAYYPSIMQGDKKVTPVNNQTGDWSEWMINSGTWVAPWNLSLSNTFSYGNFDFSFLITSKFGHKFRRLVFNYPLMPRNLPNLAMDEVLEQNGDKYFPFAAAPYTDYPLASNISRDMNWWNSYIRYMTYGIASATYFRLQEVTLAYRLPAPLVKRIGIGGLSVYLKGNNLALLTFNKYHEDPEFPLGNVRPVASGTLGINFTF